MAEYIEREAVKKVFEDFGKPLVMAPGFAARQIDAMSAADVAPVVRCSKCKHWNEPYCMLCKTRIGAGYHSRDMAYRKPDDFCSYGERKDGEG